MMNVVKAPRELEEMVNAVTKEQILANTFVTLAKAGLDRYRDCTKERVLDFDKVLRFKLTEDYWIPVTDQFLLSKGITPGEIWSRAKTKDCALKNFGPMTMITGYGDDIRFGAVGVLNHDILRDAAGRLGNFFILPSSIHEVILVPDDGDMDAEYLKETVVYANRSVVEEKEQLSDSVYRYNAESDEVEVVA